MLFILGMETQYGTYETIKKYAFYTRNRDPNEKIARVKQWNTERESTMLKQQQSQREIVITKSEMESSMTK